MNELLDARTTINLITHPFPNFNGVKPLKSGLGYVIEFVIKSYLLLYPCPNLG